MHNVLLMVQFGSMAQSELKFMRQIEKLSMANYKVETTSLLIVDSVVCLAVVYIGNKHIIMYSALQSECK